MYNLKKKIVILIFGDFDKIPMYKKSRQHTCKHYKNNNSYYLLKMKKKIMENTCVQYTWVHLFSTCINIKFVEHCSSCLNCVNRAHLKSYIRIYEYKMCGV